MKKIYIISIFDKHEDFIKLQYETIIKYVRGSYEYVIFNNASNNEQSDKNQLICETLGIKCVKIQTNYTNQPSNIAGEALNKAFNFVPNSYVFKIDSDMFFISEIDIDILFNEYDLIYVPTFIQSNKTLMWSGVFGINLNKLYFDLDFNPGVIPNTDTFGQSCLLTQNSNFRQKTLDLYMISNKVEDIISGGLNNDCVIELKNDKITIWDKPTFYDINKINVDNKLIIEYNNIVDTLEKYNFPLPYNLDFIKIDGIDFIIHFKSANWCEWYSEKYICDKKKSISDFIKNIN